MTENRGRMTEDGARVVLLKYKQVKTTVVETVK